MSPTDDTSQYVPPLHARRLKVFLCHARGDREEVEDLYGRLDNQGVQPWLDKRDIYAGEDWELAIRNAIRESDVVLVCLSPASVTHTGFVQKEIQIALDEAEKRPEGTIFIIPAKLKECTIPERLRKWQAIDISTAWGHQQLLRALWRRAAAFEKGVLFDSWSDTPVSLDELSRALLTELSRLTDRVVEIVRHRPQYIARAGSNVEYANGLNEVLAQETGDPRFDTDVTVLDESRVYLAHPSYRANVGKSHDAVWSGSVSPKFSEWFFTHVAEMERGMLSWIDNMADHLTPKRRLKRKTVASFRRVAVTPEIHWTVVIEGHELASGKK